MFSRELPWFAPTGMTRALQRYSSLGGCMIHGCQNRRAVSFQSLEYFMCASILAGSFRVGYQFDFSRPKVGASGFAAVQSGIRAPFARLEATS